MSDCVRETLCTYCIHREVCSIKMAYLGTLNKLPCISPDFNLTLSCRHYSKEVPALRTNQFSCRNNSYDSHMPIHNPVLNGPDGIPFTYSDSTSSLRG